MSTDAAWRTPLAFALWLLVFACAQSSTAPHERAPKATDPSLYQAPDSRATPDHMTEYSWHLGTTGTEMGSTSGRACFLTRVTGDFRRDRFVRIRISNGSWVLGGSRVVTAADVGVVNASARCSRVYSYTDEYYWNELQNAKVMGSINGRACFLTGVGGGMARTMTGWRCTPAIPLRGGSAAPRTRSTTPACTAGHGASSTRRSVPSSRTHTPAGSTPTRKRSSSPHHGSAISPEYAGSSRAAARSPLSSRIRTSGD